MYILVELVVIYCISLIAKFYECDYISFVCVPTFVSLLFLSFPSGPSFTFILSISVNATPFCQTSSWHTFCQHPLFWTLSYVSH